MTDEQVEAALNAYSYVEYEACYDDDESCNKYSAMRKALEAAEQAAWQDIETAPKKEMLLLKTKDGRIFTGEYNNIPFVGKGWYSPCPLVGGWGCGTDNFIKFEDDMPTNWRPLP